MKARRMTSRRAFLARAGSCLPAIALGTPMHGLTLERIASSSPGDWDLSWIDKLKGATDKAVFDWPSVSNPDEDIVPQTATGTS